MKERKEFDLEEIKKKVFYKLKYFYTYVKDYSRYLFEVTKIFIKTIDFEQIKHYLSKFLSVFHKLFRNHSYFRLMRKYHHKYKRIERENSSKKEEVNNDYFKSFVYDNLVYIMLFLTFLSNYVAKELLLLTIFPFLMLIATLLTPLFQSLFVTTSVESLDILINYYRNLGLSSKDIDIIVKEYLNLRTELKTLNDKSSFAINSTKIYEDYLENEEKLGLVLELDLIKSTDKKISSLSETTYLKPVLEGTQLYVIKNDKAYIMLDYYLAKAFYSKDIELVDIYKHNQYFLENVKDFIEERKKEKLKELEVKLLEKGIKTNVKAISNIVEKIQENSELLGFNVLDSVLENASFSGDEYNIQFSCKINNDSLLKTIKQKKETVEKILGYNLKFIENTNVKTSFTLDVKLKDKIRNLREIEEELAKVQDKQLINNLNSKQFLEALQKLDIVSEKLGFTVPYGFEGKLEGNDYYVKFEAELLEDVVFKNVLSKKSAIEKAVDYTVILEETQFSKTVFTITIIFVEYLETYKVTFDELLEPILNENKITLGRSQKGIARAQIKPSALHTLITGKTGSGKSVTACVYLTQFAYSPLLDVKDIFVLSGGKLNDFLAMKLDTAGAIIENIAGDRYKTQEEKASFLLGMLSIVKLEMDRRNTLIAKKGFSDIFEYRKKKNEDDEDLGYIFVVIDEAQSLKQSFAKLKIEKTQLGSIYQYLLEQILQQGRSAGIAVQFITQTPRADSLGQGIQDNIMFTTAGTNEETALINLDNTQTLAKYFKKLQSYNEDTRGIVFYSSESLQTETTQLKATGNYTLMKTPLLTPSEIGESFDKKYDTYKKYFNLITSYNPLEENEFSNTFFDMFEEVEEKQMKQAEAVYEEESILETYELDTIENILETEEDSLDTIDLTDI